MNFCILKCKYKVLTRNQHFSFQNWMSFNHQDSIHTIVIIIYQTTAESTLNLLDYQSRVIINKRVGVQQTSGRFSLRGMKKEIPEIIIHIRCLEANFKISKVLGISP
ncbi:hypothetical protein AQUCO_01300453v1 [Aquilegia coerulea]|uniref:Uncharacterized protein n=1 Tax=Aquilegia coerulea TaxID=218851 RepID=A0A2G5E2D6_AQUCA|nr:hypothetical protein AQUCO_01300453v1 [Aquilegia coerulea]